MPCEYEIEEVGNKKYLKIDCRSCPNNASLGNPICFRRVLSKVRDLNFVDSVIFKKNYLKVVNEKSFEILKEYLKAVEEIEKIENKDLCNECFEKDAIFRYKMLEDPIGAINFFKSIVPCEDDKDYFSKIKKIISKTKIWKAIEELSEEYSESEIYHVIFRDTIVPRFATFYLTEIPEKAKLIERYKVDGAEVKIYKGQNLTPIYTVKLPELSLSKKELEILEDAFQKISEKGLDLETAKQTCKAIINEYDLSEEEKEKLSDILYRYSFGYGVVEILLRDEKIQDVYIDSPGEKAIYLYHRDYEECETNIILSKEELEKLATRFRMISGRPFDESYPALHLDLKELKVRVCGVCEPLTFGGIGFAFRKHHTSPWTLQKFIKNKMLSAEAAGLLSFLIDSQKSILVTGPRGSGKTSLLGSLMAEIPKNNRIITIEDTPELPVDELRNLGFHIQHLRVRAELERASYEASAEEALRNALRLGESVLIIGEVRGEEARSLFEAMRVGATGNVVLGTIHGSSAYDVWDRIVNDLNVPSTSFKATDVIVTVAPIRKKESLKRHRRVTGIYEVLKHWQNDPLKEKGFLTLAEYDAKRDKLKINWDNLKKSQLMKRIAKEKGMSLSEVIKSIKLRGELRKELVKASEKNEELLEVELLNDFLTEFYKKIEKSESYTKIKKDMVNWIKSKTFKNKN